VKVKVIHICARGDLCKRIYGARSMILQGKKYIYFLVMGGKKNDGGEIAPARIDAYNQFGFG